MSCSKFSSVKIFRWIMFGEEKRIGQRPRGLRGAAFLKLIQNELLRHLDYLVKASQFSRFASFVFRASRNSLPSLPPPEIAVGLRLEKDQPYRHYKSNRQQYNILQSKSTLTEMKTFWPTSMMKNNLHITYYQLPIFLPLDVSTLTEMIGCDFQTALIKFIK